MSRSDRGVTRIVVGSSRRRGLFAALFPPLAEELVRRAEALEVLVTPGIQDEAEERRAPRRELPTPAAEYPLALLPVLVAVLLGLATRDALTIADHALINLLAILIAASITGRGPAFLATLTSVASFDFFFIPPYYTFAVSDLHHVLTFAVMLVVGFIASQRTIQIREQAARLAGARAAHGRAVCHDARLRGRGRSAGDRAVERRARARPLAGRGLPVPARARRRPARSGAHGVLARRRRARGGGGALGARERQARGLRHRHAARPRARSTCR